MDAPENTCVKGTANSPQGRYKQVQPTPLIGVGAPATISLLLKFCGFYNTMIQLRQTICIFLSSYISRVFDLVANGLNYRANRMQSSLLELLRCSR